MTLKLTGYYTLPTETEPRLFDFNDVFDAAFKLRYTRYRSCEKFLAGGGFSIACQKDFEELPEEKMDAHVKKTTKFSSWQEMLDWGTNQYILHQQN